MPFFHVGSRELIIEIKSLNEFNKYIAAKECIGKTPSIKLTKIKWKCPFFMDPTCF